MVDYLHKQLLPIFQRLATVMFNDDQYFLCLEK